LNRDWWLLICQKRGDARAATARAATAELSAVTSEREISRHTGGGKMLQSLANLAQQAFTAFTSAASGTASSDILNSSMGQATNQEVITAIKQMWMTVVQKAAQGTHG
jgi:hypothetical protein